MAAPTPTARTIPTGYILPDGFKSLVTLAEDPAIQFWEKTPKPPDIDGGEPIMQSTMHNIKWHTYAPRTLIKIGAITGKAAYDPEVLIAILAMINFPTTVTFEYPSHATLCAYGWLQKFTGDTMEEGKQPEAEFTICISNYDYVHGVEAGPVFTPSSGTV